MNFKLGFIAGTAAGYSLARFLTPEQKRTIEEKVAATGVGDRVGQVTDTLRRNGAKVADTVAARATSAVDGAGDRAADVISPGGDSPTTFGEADREPTAAESAAADKAAEEAPDVGDTYDEMARRGGEQKGEGRVP